MPKTLASCKKELIIQVIQLQRDIDLSQIYMII